MPEYSPPLDLDRSVTLRQLRTFKTVADLKSFNAAIEKDPKLKAKSGDQWTDWDAIKGRRIFDQILARNGNKVNASIAANDGLAGAIISSLKAHGLKPIPVSGQDATPTGVQYILAGWQSGTVYKSVRKEANAAALAAMSMQEELRLNQPGKGDDRLAMRIILTVGDVLFHRPRRYEPAAPEVAISDLFGEEEVAITGEMDRGNPVRKDLALFNTVRLRFDLQGVTPEQGAELVEAFKGR